jgi:hypothetical protein
MFISHSYNIIFATAAFYWHYKHTIYEREREREREGERGGVLEKVRALE